MTRLPTSTLQREGYVFVEAASSAEEGGLPLDVREYELMTDVQDGPTYHLFLSGSALPSTVCTRTVSQREP